MKRVETHPLSVIRRILRKNFRNLGFQRRIAPDFADVMLANNIDIVFDCGANDGGFGREIRDRGYRGLIVSFEPNPDAYARLRASIKFDKRWIAYPIALGNKNGVVDFFINDIDVMSSIKELNEFGRSTKAKVVRIEKINLSRLDSFIEDHPELSKNIYLKLDTQGSEMDVLLGAGERLAEIAVVQTELSLIHSYKDEPEWLEVVSWLRARGFDLVTAICNSAVGAQAREFDFVFLNRHLRP